MTLNDKLDNSKVSATYLVRTDPKKEDKDLLYLLF